MSNAAKQWGPTEDAAHARTYSSASAPYQLGRVLTVTLIRAQSINLTAEDVTAALQTVFKKTNPLFTEKWAVLK
ncbi:hypothetical protein [Streptomyces sp. NBC_01643]|uniref:hypothetical protein n=1 Tax=Streptomyces sp. NBC_01643 TaxID=2975906 RepID=UPI002F90CB79|nr:hypothetical protein OHB03_47985 [Streptomyces sp. NBC_01643]